MPSYGIVMKWTLRGLLKRPQGGLFRKPRKADKERRKVETEQIAQLCRSFTDQHFGDVMVVGGGISGIQAALDLATAGFRVYLVEKSPAIGGHMAQLDKTYPTNDCSM